MCLSLASVTLLPPSPPCQSSANDLLASDIFASEPPGQTSPTGQPAAPQTNPLDLFKTSAPSPMGPLAGLGMFPGLESAVALLLSPIVMAHRRKALSVLVASERRTPATLPSL